MRNADTAVAVVGAGPYGLSVSAHLNAQGVEHEAFGDPMSMWAEKMPRGMYLKSEPFASDLADPARRATLRAHYLAHGLGYADIGAPIPLETFIEYGRSFQKELVPQLRNVEVNSLTREGSVYRLVLSDDSELHTPRVVLATGAAPFAYIPESLAQLPRELVSHSSDHRDFHGLVGREVVVVGAGQGALESAALLHEAGASVRVLVRAPELRWNTDPRRRTTAERLRWPVSPLGTGWDLRFYATVPDLFRRLPANQRLQRVRTVLGPAGAWWLRERIEDRVPVACSAAIVDATATGSGVRLSVATAGGGSTVMSADHVVAGTGYRVDLSRLPFLSAGLREEVRALAGSPLLSRDFESTAPGLFFVGLPAAVAFGPVQRFVAGAPFTASRVATALRRGR